MDVRVKHQSLVLSYGIVNKISPLKKIIGRERINKHSLISFYKIYSGEECGNSEMVAGVQKLKIQQTKT